METGRTNPIGADQRHRRRRQAPQEQAEIGDADSAPQAGFSRTAAPRAVTWPANYYMTAQEWMEKVRLIRK
jgi:hypothetical protein